MTLVDSVIVHSLGSVSATGTSGPILPTALTTISIFPAGKGIWHAARHRTAQASSGVADSFETLKDEVEAEFKLARVVVAGLQNVLHR